MAARHGHFMPTSLLDSQFRTLEEPAPDENPLVVSIGAPAGDRGRDRRGPDGRRRKAPDSAQANRTRRGRTPVGRNFSRKYARPARRIRIPLCLVFDTPRRPCHRGGMLDDTHAGNRPNAYETLFPGGGEMGARLRAHDWAATSLGPIEAWPQSLTMAVRIMLGSRFAMWMAWGPDLTFFCNDAYGPTLGRQGILGAGLALGRGLGRDLARYRPRIAQVLRTGEATWDEALAALPGAARLCRGELPHLLLQPARDDAGTVNGPCSASSRRRPSGSSASGACGPCATSAPAWRRPGPRRRSARRRRLPRGGDRRLPVALAYLAGDAPALLARAGIGPDHPAAERAAEAAAAAMGHLDPADPIGQTSVLLPVEALGPLFAALPSGPWDRPPTTPWSCRSPSRARAARRVCSSRA